MLKPVQQHARGSFACRSAGSRRASTSASRPGLAAARVSTARLILGPILHMIDGVASAVTAMTGRALPRDCIATDR